MKQTFKQFMEAAVTPLQQVTITDGDLMRKLENYASVSLEAFQTNQCEIFRGWNTAYKDARRLDLTQSVRKSQNTSNYYTRFFDTNPANDGWPKRSQSLICTTSYETAKGYSNVAVMLPEDSVEFIAVCPSKDIWFEFITVENKKITIQNLNNILKHSGLPEDATYSDFEKFINEVSDEKLNELVAKHSVNFLSTTIFSKEVLNKLRKDWLDMYDYNKRGFDLVEVGSPIPEDREVWFGGAAFSIPIEKVNLLAN